MAITFYSWNKVNQPSIKPMTWVGVNTYTSADLDTAATNLKALPEGSRYLFLWHFGVNENGTDRLLSVGNPSGAFVRYGNFMTDRTIVRNILTGLNTRGAKPDFIAVDYEKSITTYNPEFTAGEAYVEFARQVLDDPVAKAKLPDILTETPYSVLTDWNTGGEIIQAWRKAIYTVRSKAVYYATASVAKEVYGTCIPCSNFDDMKLGDTKAFFSDDSPYAYYTGNRSVNGYSSPMLYFGNSGVDRWRLLYSKLNYVRGLVNYTNPRYIIPWITYPGWAGGGQPEEVDTYVWEQLIRHCRAMGITKFLYWNPNDELDDGADAQAIITECDSIRTQSKPSTGWPSLIPVSNYNRLATGEVVSIWPHT